jgi:predicted HicB family RNase H-like nuclease
MSDDRQQLIVRLEPSLHRRLKVKAASESTTMQDIALKAIEKAVKP